ncbi:hypothetical protein [Micromonospora zhanjiangensis]
MAVADRGVLLTAAVLALSTRLPVTGRLPGVEAPVPAEPVTGGGPSAASADGPVTGPTPSAAPAGYWSARPEWVPWWRRRGPVTGVVIGAVVLVFTAAAGIWLAVHQPGPEPDLKPMLVSAPQGATRVVQLGGGPDSPGAGELASLTGGVPFWSGSLRRYGIRQLAAVGWATSDGTDVAVVLSRFDRDSADSLFKEVGLLQGPLGAGVVVSDVPGVPAGKLLTISAADPAGRVQTIALARRGDLVVVVQSLARPPADTAMINALVREQYGRM